MGERVSLGVELGGSSGFGGMGKERGRRMARVGRDGVWREC